MSQNSNLIGFINLYPVIQLFNRNDNIIMRTLYHNNNNSMPLTTNKIEGKMEISILFLLYIIIF